MKHKKRALLKSALSLLLCVAMLTGTTFAWFTDSVVSGYNTIAAGNLDVALHHSNAAVTDEPVDSTTKLFMDLQGNPILWEPGVVSYENLRVTNEGDLALAYQLSVNTANENYIVDPSGAQYGLSRALKVGVVEGGITTADRAGILESVKETGWYTLESFLRGGALLPEGEGVFEKTWGVVIYWEPGENDNLLNLNNGKQLNEGDVLSIDLGIKLVATQEGHESDVFGDDYDSDAKAEFFPDFVGGTSSIPVVVNEQYQTVSESVKTFGKVTVTVPAGVQLTAGTTALPVSIGRMGGSNANVELGENEILRSLDVHVGGMSGDNRTPITVSLQEAAPKGLNMGNYKLFHVEADGTKEMTLVAAADAFTAHNQFKYDPATGDLTLYMASFSEVAVVADTENAWNGEFDYSWYTNVNPDARTTDYIIASADQLAAFGAIVGGMNGQTADSFSGKTVKLLSDINLGDKNNANENLIFHPIGYYYTDDKNEDGTTGDYYSTVSSFEGTFDGNGHTIANFYQNTWEIKGDYDGNYYDDAMGLFGYVVNGTVKNLTVDNFSSDGEYAPTGVIAAYAVNSTFENIAITNCNPRVYNTGNGGIVGIGGNSDDPDTYKLTFNNITIDNTNKITALWGSWDVACGGLVGMFRGAGHVHMTNCHVAAQIDVYNDVCGNYQYYWYRYSGMMVGTNKNMITDKDGYTVPETSKFHAENCTVHFGDWNDYYYCELVANSLASYTHDHQFSRLEQIQNVSEIQDANGNWLKTGNFILMNGKTPTDTCYHIVNKNGVLTQHNHADAGTETVDGQTVLKENNQRIYLPFNQLFTGYGWGVKHIPVYNGEDYAFKGITILDREVAKSEVKFAKADTAKDSYTTESTVTIGELFKAAEIKDEKLSIKGDNVQVTVSPVGENSTASGTYAANTTDWTQGTLTFTGTGTATVTITDYYFCKPTTITVNITERVAEEKFETKFTGDFLYRVGNQNAVKLDSLFKAKDGVTVGNKVSVTIDALNGTGASGTYTSNAPWTSGTIQFTGTGVVKVTITDNDFCISTELILEVVDAVNATTATNATANNVVLLNDCGFSSLEVSGGYALYGNGFTMTCASDSASLTFGQFVKLDNGTLDNVQIVCPNYDYAALYNSQLTGGENRSQTTDRTRYYNAKSAVLVTGNSQILNSRISGGRAALYASNGNIVVDNSRLEGGAVANVIIGAANSFVFRDTTLIQKPTASTYDSSKTLMGMSVLYLCNADGDATPTTIEGEFVQYAWADASCTAYMPAGTSGIADTVLKKTDYTHTVDGKTCVNLGFAYMPNEGTTVNEPSNITDKRDDKSTIPYAYEAVSAKVPVGGFSTDIDTYVYSYKNTNGTDTSFSTEKEYVPNKYSDIITVMYSDTADGLTTGKTFGTDGWVYELNVDLDKLSGYALDFSKLTMTVNGVAVTDYKVNSSAKPSSPVAVTAGGTEYKLSAIVNGKDCVVTLIVTGVETSKRGPYLVNASGDEITKDEIAWEPYLNLKGTSGLDSVYAGAVPVLEGVYITYWSVSKSQYVQLSLSKLTPSATGKVNGTNSYWEYEDPNGDFTLHIEHNKNPFHSTPIYGMPVVYEGTLYFVPASSKGLVTSASGARTPTFKYTFTDNNGGELEFEKTWTLTIDTKNTVSYTTVCGESSGSSGGGSCLAAGTMITMADGSKRAVENLRKGDLVMSYDHLNGKITSNEVIIVVKTAQDNYHKNTFIFDDGTELVTINEHGIYDWDLRKYVNIDHENGDEFIGHKFVAVDSKGKISLKKLMAVESVVESGYKYDIVTKETLNYVAEDTLSVTHVLVDVINSFDFNRFMRYKPKKMQEDIAKYGLYTYDEWAEYCDISVFEQYNIPVMKVGISKGLYTQEYIVGLINTYVLDESVQIID